MMAEDLKEYIAENIIQVSQDVSQENYSSWAKNYDQNVGKDLGFVIPEEVVKLMKKLNILKDNYVILDVGAGNSVFTRQRCDE